MRRPLVVAAAATAVAGLLVLLASGRTWGAVTVRSGVGARQHLSVTGHNVAPGLSALAIALLALSVALLAASGVVRRLVGLLVVVVGAAVLPVAIDGRRSVGRELAQRAFAAGSSSLGGSRAWWWLLAFVGGVIAVAAGAVVAVRGRRWSGMGTRYDAPGTAPTKDPSLDTWEALDKGHDPTE